MLQVVGDAEMMVVLCLGDLPLRLDTICPGAKQIQQHT
jgi:hypothetical protein